MDHQPYESWLVVDEPLLPDQEANLQEHLKSCASCRQLHNSWQDVEALFVEQTIVQPKPGFTERWQVRLAKEFSQENERQQRRSSWIFLGSTTGAAFLVLIIMAIGFFSTVQNSTEVFISGKSEHLNIHMFPWIGTNPDRRFKHTNLINIKITIYY